MQRITLSPDGIGLHTVPGVFLTFGPGCGDSGDEIVLEGVHAAPHALGVRGDGTINTTWIYSATQQTLTIDELHTGMHHRVIQS
ncbi:MAG: hypothetical protein GY930_05645 [bacterium]|nr:hypothetical protein [bacterium]